MTGNIFGCLKKNCKEATGSDLTKDRSDDVNTPLDCQCKWGGMIKYNATTGRYDTSNCTASAPTVNPCPGGNGVATYKDGVCTCDSDPDDDGKYGYSVHLWKEKPSMQACWDGYPGNNCDYEYIQTDEFDDYGWPVWELIKSVVYQQAENASKTEAYSWYGTCP